MTTNQLKNWMRGQLEQGNNIAVVTGSGYATTNNEAIINDVDAFDNISIVDDAEVEQMVAGQDQLSNHESIVKLTNRKGDVLYVLTDIPQSALIEQALINYAINSVSSTEVAQLLNVDANDIQQALNEFNDEWDEADEPSDADAVIDKWVEFLTTHND